MNKKAMSLVTLIVSVIVMVMLAGVMTINVSKVNINSKVMQDMDLENVQQLANMAYASIYLDNLRQGVRRELTELEIRAHIIKNSTGKIDIQRYNINIKDGDVFVSVKEEQ